MPKGLKGFQKGHPAYSDKGRFIKGQHASIGTQFKKGLVPWNKGLSAKCDDRVKRFVEAGHAAMKHKVCWNKGKKCPPLTLEHKIKMSKALKGKYVRENSSNWKGGISGESKLIRMSSMFKDWRHSVFLRDNWTCQDCGIRGGLLHPHHIKPFALYADLRFDVSNGITLCEKCHRNTDTWGFKNIYVVKRATLTGGY